MKWTVKLFVCWIALKLSSAEEKIELEIAQGKLNGLKNITKYNGIPYYSFRGIPYAKPNIGRDRFNVAVPLDSWSGVYDATKHGNSCLQSNIDMKISGHEDCLFLNVYTQNLNQRAGKAVMVYIHGGTFVIGSGNDFLYGPDFLIEKDVVLVTINYRLGVIGFLNTGDASAPGNIGLKDQNLALKWVQSNIINFGGDPKRVTIFGQSAGAASVHYHMLSPMSQGLFKGAIVQSGAAVSPWAITYTPRDNAMALGELFQLNITDTLDMVEKLKDIDGRDLVAAGAIVAAGNIMRNSFVPSVENDVGQDIFISNDPWKLIKYGDIADVPMIIGLTKNEFSFITETIMALKVEYLDLMYTFIPSDLNMTDPALRNETVEKFLDFYFNNELTNRKVEAFSELLDDLIINHGSLLSAGIMNSRMSSPVYEYLFNYYTPLGVMRGSTPVKGGIIHCDDLVFLFFASHLDNMPELGSHDAEMTDKMIEMWTNFAKEGDPSVTMNAAKIKWEPMGDDGKYLDISDELAMKKSLFKERVKLWANVYSDVLDDYAKIFN